MQNYELFVILPRKCIYLFGIVLDFSYFCAVNWQIIHISETDSTNRWLKAKAREAEALGFKPRSLGLQPLNPKASENILVWTDFQTAGRGCGTNTWESERGKNLLFSMLIYPEQIHVTRQFHISMAVSLAICEALGKYIGDLSIKWPNDIYWRNGKICGILIENRIKGSTIKESIIGVGLNVNQREFRSDAPNPVSVWQICERETDREQLLKDILQSFDKYMDPSNLSSVGEAYREMLYRRKGFHPYTDKDGAFMAELVDVEDDGHLVLHDEDGKERRYTFKEVQFVI